MLALFWTDLDGTGEPGIFAAVLSDDDDNAWLVLEWRVHVFGDADADRFFQLWIGLNGAEDITFAYDPAALPGDPGIPVAVGARTSTAAVGSTSTAYRPRTCG